MKTVDTRMLPVPEYYLKRICLPIICWLLLIVSPFKGSAQDEGVRIDSTVVGTVDEDEEVAVADEEIPPAVKMAPDTPSLRLVNDSVVRELQKSKDFAYANDSKYWEKLRKEREAEKKDRKYDPNEKSGWDYVNAFFNNDIVKGIFYSLLIAGILFVVYRILSDNNLIPGSRKRSNSGSEEIEEDIIRNEDALAKKLQQAISERDYRVAVRYLFLQALRTLDNKGWIRYHAEGTNNEYLVQVREHGAAKEFGFLTNVYEYVWYGEFELTDEQFKQAHEHFIQFQNSIRS